jgi:hypothetical protein
VDEAVMGLLEFYNFGLVFRVLGVRAGRLQKNVNPKKPENPLKKRKP